MFALQMCSPAVSRRRVTVSVLARETSAGPTAKRPVVETGCQTGGPAGESKPRSCAPGCRRRAGCIAGADAVPARAARPIFFCLRIFLQAGTRTQEAGGEQSIRWAGRVAPFFLPLFFLQDDTSSESLKYSNFVGIACSIRATIFHRSTMR